jgi:FkbM family methyltransferase
MIYTKVFLRKVKLFFQKFVSSTSESDIQGEFVSTLYKELFQRVPDEEGYRYWSNQLDAGETHSNLLIRFLNSEEYTKNLPRILARNILELPLVNSFSQYEEDQILVKKLIEDSIKKPFVVDVGAHSINGSNTFLFSHHFNWPTLLIEANSDLIPNLKFNFPKKTKIINVAIGLEEGQAEFHVSKNSYVSSLDKNQAEQWGETLEKRIVPMRRLADVLSDNSVPQNFTLLSIDIEGLDRAVIEDLLSSSDYRPLYIVAEIRNLPISSHVETWPIAKEFQTDYELLASTHANTILGLKNRSDFY